MVERVAPHPIGLQEPGHTRRGGRAAPPGRYTIFGSDALERRIFADIEKCVSAIRGIVPSGMLEAVVLGGGFGRGEGGVLRTGVSESPYNDYDLFAITTRVWRPVRWALRRRLVQCAEELGRVVDLEVEVGLITRDELEDGPITLMRCDLRHGGRVVYGDPHVLERMPPLPPALIPLREATRLLVNRGALLLMAREELERTGERPDFERVARYARKAVLACGDAWLIAHNGYRPSWLERAGALREVASTPEWLLSAYPEAIDHRLRGTPARAPAELAQAVSDLAPRLLDMLLAVERLRLDQPTLAWQNYGRAVQHPSSLDERYAPLAAMLPHVLSGVATRSAAEAVPRGEQGAAGDFLARWRHAN
jgi:hypothetical protein